ncbi:MAG TPA: hypothetical protein VJ964_01670, partial [Balneolaceae bacterium]|nr:hypothetical protein [Balneolaceae bacterium]
MKRLKNTFLLVGSLGIALMSSACKQPPPHHPQNTLARVGNHYLTVEKAKEEIPNFIFKQDSAIALKRYRDQWIQNQLVLEEANRLGLSQKENVRRKLQRAREEVLRQALKEYVIASKKEDTTISDSEARSYFQAHKEQFALNEKFVKFRHIKTKTMK